MFSRNTYLEINLKNYIDNLRSIEKSSNSKVIPVVKCNAYGCGAVEIADISEKAGINLIAVAFLEEAEKIRNSGINSEILIFNCIRENFIEKIIENNFIVTIYSKEQIKNYIKFNQKSAVKIKYHININTGMNNLGINIEELDELAEIIQKYNLNTEGIYTHFSDADRDEEYTRKQYKILNQAEKILMDKRIKIKVKHVSNSAAVVSDYEKDFKTDYVRSGMALYGIQPLKNKEITWIKDVITWKSSVSKVRVIDKGESLNYGKSFTSPQKMKIAVIPVGYGDGYKMGMSNCGYVVIKNYNCYIRGVVCMDQITVEIPEEIEVIEGEEVILLGKSYGISAEKIAEISGTIPDDVICSISREIPRVYIK